MEDRFRRRLTPSGSPRLRVALAFGLLASLGGGAQRTDDAGAGTAATAGSMRYATVRPRPFMTTLGVSGTLVPGDRVDLLAPFDSMIQSLRFAFGDRVSAGQILAVLDSHGIDRQISEAEIAAIEAGYNHDMVAGWSHGPEMARARRQLASAKSDLDALDRRIKDARGLLARGLIPRNEVDMLDEQRLDLESALAAAREELAATQARGSPPQQRKVALAWESARAHLDDLRRQRENAIVKAPADGVIVRPEGARSETPDLAHAGSRVSRGQRIAVIARSDQLDVAFTLDEADLPRVLPGMPVQVTGPAFPGLTLPGRVSAIAGQGSMANPAATTAIFPASARLDPIPADLVTRVRVGMTANVVITTSREENALVVPPEAIQDTPVGPVLLVVSDAAAVPRRVRVRLGRAAPDGVVVVSGLKAGDRIAWPVTTDTTPTAPDQ